MHFIFELKWPLMTSSIGSSSIYDVIEHPEDGKEGFPKKHTKLDHDSKFCPKWETKRHFLAFFRFSYRRFTFLQCSWCFFNFRLNIRYLKRFNSSKWLQTWRDVAYLRGKDIGLFLPVFDTWGHFMTSNDGVWDHWWRQQFCRHQLMASLNTQRMWKRVSRKIILNLIIIPSFVRNGRPSVIFWHLLDFHIEGSQYCKARGCSTILDQISAIGKDVTLSNDFKLGQMMNICEAKILV